MHYLFHFQNFGLAAFPALLLVLKLGYYGCYESYGQEDRFDQEQTA